MKLVNKNDFVEAILSHKEGFLISTGDASCDVKEPFSINSVFFGIAYIVNGNNNLLAFDNKLNTKVVNGKCEEVIYTLTYSLLNTNTILSIREYDGNYLSDTFETDVQRVFEIEIKDEVHQSSNLYCIGLL